MTFRGGLSRGLAVLAALALAPPAPGGLVVSRSARQSGALALQPGAIRVADASVPWGDVLLAFSELPAGGNPQPEALWLRNGEVWPGAIDKLSGGNAAVRTPLGAATVPADAVLAIDFQPGLPPVERAPGGQLLRAKGKPVSGALLWIEDARVGIDSPLGALSLARKDLRRYIFAEPAAAVAPAAELSDEVGLADGTVLRGQIEPQQDALLVKHPLLGEKRIPAGGWQWLRRHPAAVTYLAEGAPAAVETFPLIRNKVPAPRVEASRSGELYVRRIQVWPRSVLRYAIPAGADKGRFRAAAGLAPGSRGAARIRFTARERVLLEQVLAAGAAPAAVEFGLDGVTELALEVDFDQHVALPCRVVVDDPLVAAR